MIVLHTTEGSESICKYATFWDAITDGKENIRRRRGFQYLGEKLRCVAGMDVVDEFPNIVVASLAASSYQDGAPLLAPGRVEDNIAQVLLPRNLCHVRNGRSRSRERESPGERVQKTIG